MMLVTGISRQTIAQTNTTNKTFEVPNGSLSNRYSIDLGKGNTLQVEIADKNDIVRFKNIDSILTDFFKNIIPLQDSLADKLAARKIDYVMDAAGRKKIRISIFKPLASSFVIRKEEVSALKSEKDTLNIIGIVTGTPSTKFKCRDSFFIPSRIKNRSRSSIAILPVAIAASLIEFAIILYGLSSSCHAVTCFPIVILSLRRDSSNPGQI